MYGYLLIFFCFAGLSFALVSSTFRSALLAAVSGLGSTYTSAFTGIADFITAWIVWALTPGNIYGMFWLGTVLLIPTIMLIQGAKGRMIR